MRIRTRYFFGLPGATMGAGAAAVFDAAFPLFFFVGFLAVVFIRQAWV
jgi:hypothetical protein